jgi:hypothetical protein
MLKRVKAGTGRRWRALRSIEGPRDALAMLPVFGMALVFTILLRLKLSKLALKWLRSLKPGEEPPSEEELQRIVRRSDTALLLGRPALRSECLARSCLLYYQMRRAGAAADIRFGVMIDDGTFRSHCWIMIDGAPRFEDETERLDRFKGVFNLNP